MDQDRPNRDRMPLRASYEEGPAEPWLNGRDDVLAVFEFGQSPLASTDPRHVPVALPQLDAPQRVEVWRCDGPIKGGTWDRLRFAQGAELTMGHIVLDLREAEEPQATRRPQLGETSEASGTRGGGLINDVERSRLSPTANEGKRDSLDLREASRQAYDLLRSYLQQSPHPWPLKIWNYIPAINQGAGDDERYRQFCLGRADAVLIDPGDLPPLPAATAIGSPSNEPALQVYFLAGALPGLDVENPRQVSAWRYPRQYGPRSPLFSRGTILTLDGPRQFLISGTASVVGHETHHENQVADQLRESLRNVRRLLDEGHRLMGDSRPRLDRDGLLKVYIRNPADYERIRQTFEAEIPAGIPRIYLQGDICRANLLTEIDGIVACERVAPAPL